MDAKGSGSDQGSQFQKKYKNNGKGSKRFKPYFGSEKEGQGFADLRKKKAAREYLKFLQQERKQEETKGNETTGEKPPLNLYNILSRTDQKKGKGHTFSRAEKIAEEKKKRKEEEKEKYLKDKEARDAAMNAYKKKKKENFLKLCKKTKKGQPVMKNQMEVLLDKILKHKGIKPQTGESSTQASKG